MSSVFPSPADLPASIPALVLRAAQLHGDAIALEDGAQRIAYAELPERMLEVSRALIAAGIGHGDRVAIWAPNSIEWVLLALGLQAAGAVMVPLNTRMKGSEAADILDRSGTRLLFVQGQFLGNDYPAMLAPVRPAGLEQVVVIGESAAAEQALSAFLAGGQAVSAQQALERAQSVGSDDLSDLLFTSGTTGKPKGVMYAHGQSLRAFNEYVRIIGLVPGDRYLIVNPFFHSFGYKAGWLTCLLGGATILPQAMFDADDVFRRVEQDKVTILPGPPTLYLSMLDHPRRGATDLSSLRVAVTGASTIPPVLIKRMREELGFTIVTTAYGLTECGGLATICDPQDSAQTIAGTSGKPIPGTELGILDAEGNALSQGEQGEICLRGFHVMQGYFNNDQATAEALDAQGWLHTGDVGSLDVEGNLRITGRLKDMFIVGGFNCYPAEIEAALSEHPSIAQVAVLGVPDERMGEVGCACVVLRQGEQVSDADLISWSRERMANYKVPRRIAFYRELPTNASNKVDKLLLARQLAG
ncbi:FadD3 family acyl-CoA ligase [Halopseudomonas aestusnigri]|uniref:Acyl-CoA synthetase (AMP-forming)/AMP-acid ligase II n=1 Tax=Halopseudomonas aestusnigri TaxID=857252 RepID=A0AAQ1G648_9GAMM|nr:FadD3 family acyl-CoA ligase [Halopseudomonas aestusnigri]OWL89230.1 fatty acid--CoA ligase [Halopseudomonas aestusnigri]SEG06257.1 Acyl-CoA synthetase (AMP-forming)/AMP-acid ligase II [Halopseudomonas aestusnigri]